MSSAVDLLLFRPLFTHADGCAVSGVAGHEASLLHLIKQHGVLLLVQPLFTRADGGAAGGVTGHESSVVYLIEYHCVLLLF